MPRSRYLTFVMSIAGWVGVVLCVAAAVGVWWLYSAAANATDVVADRAGESLAAARGAIDRASDRLEASQITAGKLTGLVERWARERTARAAAERLAERADLETALDQVTAAVAYADDWLALAESSIGLAEQFDALVAAPSDADDESVLADAAENLAALRTRAAEAKRGIERVREALFGGDDKPSLADRAERAKRLVVALVATVTSLDERLDGFGETLAAGERRVERIRATTKGWLLLAAVLATVLAVWMGAGQVCLARRTRGT